MIGLQNRNDRFVSFKLLLKKRVYAERAAIVKCINIVLLLVLGFERNWDFFFSGGGGGGGGLCCSVPSR